MSAKKRVRLNKTSCTASTERGGGKHEMADLDPALQKAVRRAVQCCSISGTNDYNGSVGKC